MYGEIFSIFYRREAIFLLLVTKSFVEKRIFPLCVELDITIESRWMVRG